MGVVAVAVSTKVDLNSNVPVVLVAIQQALEDCYVLRFVQLVLPQSNAVLVATISRRIPRQRACVAAVGCWFLQ